MLVFMTSAVQPHLGSQNAGSLARGGGRTRHPDGNLQDAVSLSGKTAGLPESWQVQDALQAKAVQIRSQDAALQAVVRHVRKMADDTRAFKKNFPPFPQGSEERERLLNSFSAIRKQIARLTIPPETREAAAAGERTAPPEPALATITAAFERLFAAIRERIPSVPRDTSDRSFGGFEKKLESFLEFIQGKRGEIKQQIFSANDYAIDDDSGPSMAMAVTSMQISRTFSEQPDWQMTVSQMQLRAL